MSAVTALPPRPASVTPALYPFASHVLSRDGLRYHYLDEGPRDGELVVMVHGNPTWSFYFRDVVLALRDRFRCVVPDHIGCGFSDKPSDDRYAYTLASRVDDLAALIDHVTGGDTTKKVSLVVHDWGGMIGMAWAARNTERIARLVVLNTAAFPLPEAKRFPFLLRLVRTPVGALLVRGGNAFAGLASHVGTTRGRLPRALRRAYTAPYDTWEHRIATLRFVEDIPLEPGDRAWPILEATERALSKLAHVPMLIGWGTKDFVFDAHFLREWQARFPDAEVHRFDDAGHYVLEDAKAELLPAIRAFFDRPLG